jgi:protein-L-isoaspartate(D-aspartate) O-methyltransferase
MVANQVEARGITDSRVLRMMREVPRHLFVDRELAPKAYDDSPLAIGCGQTISQPYMVALMTGLLDLQSDDRVLEVGTGSGYQTALLAKLARSVVSIERYSELSERARQVLNDLDITNVTTLVGDGSLGCQDDAPFNKILVTAGSPSVPHSLCRQLVVGGRLVCPVGSRDDQEIVSVVRNETGFEQEHGVRCRFVPLVGEEGWESE